MRRAVACAAARAAAGALAVSGRCGCGGLRWGGDEQRGERKRRSSRWKEPRQDLETWRWSGPQETRRHGGSEQLERLARPQRLWYTSRVAGGRTAQACRSVQRSPERCRAMRLDAQCDEPRIRMPPARSAARPETARERDCASSTVDEHFFTKSLDSMLLFAAPPPRRGPGGRGGDGVMYMYMLHVTCDVLYAVMIHVCGRGAPVGDFVRSFPPRRRPRGE